MKPNFIKLTYPPRSAIDRGFMSFEEYIREKAAESRHKETTGFSLLVLGMIMLIGGFTITLITIGKPDWFLFIPWKRTSEPTSLISLAMTLSGFVLAFSGAAYIMFASSERAWYIRSLSETIHRTRKSEEELLRDRLKALRRKIEKLREET